MSLYLYAYTYIHIYTHVYKLAQARVYRVQGSGLDCAVGAVLASRKK